MEEGMASDDFEFTAGDDTEAGQYAATLVSIERKETKEGDFFRVWHFKTVTGAELSGSSSPSSGRPRTPAARALPAARGAAAWRTGKPARWPGGGGVPPRGRPRVAPPPGVPVELRPR